MFFHKINRRRSPRRKRNGREGGGGGTGRGGKDGRVGEKFWDTFMRGCFIHFPVQRERGKEEGKRLKSKTIESVFFV